MLRCLLFWCLLNFAVHDAWLSLVLPGCYKLVRTCLALALLVTWVVADNHDSTVATDDLALVANLLDAWVNLHVSYFCLGLLLTDYQTALTQLDLRRKSLFVAVDDATTSQVVCA